MSCLPVVDGSGCRNLIVQIWPGGVGAVRGDSLLFQRRAGVDRVADPSIPKPCHCDTLGDLGRGACHDGARADRNRGGSSNGSLVQTGMARVAAVVLVVPGWWRCSRWRTACAPCVTCGRYYWRQAPNKYGGVTHQRAHYEIAGEWGALSGCWLAVKHTGAVLRRGGCRANGQCSRLPPAAVDNNYSARVAAACRANCW